MAKTQSRSARGSCNSEDERRSSSAEPRGRSPVVERDTKTKGKKGARGSSPSLSHANSTKRKLKKSVQTLSESSEDEASDSELEPEESSSSDSEESDSDTSDDEIPCDPDFDFVGADLCLKAVDRTFRVHIHMFKDFSGLESEIDEAPMEEDEGYKILTLNTSAEDIQRVLTVLYTKPYEPHDFDPKVFESCLKLATEYGNPGLRNYAIQHLERYSLEPVDQFRLGRDCGLPEWRSKAIVTLSERDKPLTEMEAEVLGPATFATIAIARERAQYAKGHREGMGQTPTATGLGAQSAAQRPPVATKV